MGFGDCTGSSNICVQLESLSVRQADFITETVEECFLGSISPWQTGELRDAIESSSLLNDGERQTEELIFL